VWRLATANAGNSALAAVLIVVAHLIGGVGIVLCFVGVLFTSVYAYGVTAGIVDWFRRTQIQPSPAGPSLAG